MLLLRQSFLYSTGCVTPQIQVSGFVSHLLLLQCLPCQPSLHWHLLGSTQVPYRPQLGSQTAVKSEHIHLGSWHFIQRQSHICSPCSFTWWAGPGTGCGSQSKPMPLHWVQSEPWNSPHSSLYLQGLAQPLARQSGCTAGLSIHQNKPEKESSPQHPTQKCSHCISTWQSIDILLSISLILNCYCWADTLLFYRTQE